MSNRELISQQASYLDSMRSGSLAHPNGSTRNDTKPEDSIDRYGKTHDPELWRAKIAEFQAIISSYLEIIYTEVRPGAESITGSEENLNPNFSANDIDKINQTIKTLTDHIARLKEFQIIYEQTLKQLGEDAFSGQLQETV